MFAVIGALRFDRAGSQRKRESVAERLNGASKIVQRQRDLKKSGDGKVVNLTFREAAKAIIEAGRVARVERLQKRRERRDSMQNYRRGLLAAPQPPVTIRTASIFNPLDIVPEENEVRHGLSYRDGKKSVSEERLAETPRLKKLLAFVRRDRDHEAAAKARAAAGGSGRFISLLSSRGGDRCSFAKETRDCKGEPSCSRYRRTYAICRGAWEAFLSAECYSITIAGKHPRCHSNE